mgnify:CR=1 FL=1
MKYRSIVVVLLLLCTYQAQAQDQRSFTYGFKLGISGSAIHGLDKIKIPRPPSDVGLFDVLRVAPHGGIFVTYKIPNVLGPQYIIDIVKRLSVGTELTVSNVGFIHDYLGIKLSYFNIPLLCMFQVRKAPHGVLLYLGPQVEFLRHAMPLKVLVPFFEEHDFNTMIWSLVWGVQYISPIGVNLDFRYNCGLSDITQPHGFWWSLHMTEGTWFTNQYVQLSLSVDVYKAYKGMRRLGETSTRPKPLGDC